MTESMYYLTVMVPACRYRYANPAPDRSLPVSVAGLGVRERMPPMFVDRPTGLDHFLFIHFHDAAQVLIRGQDALRPAHTFVLWPPRSRHLFGHAGRPWLHSWMYCSGTKAAAWLASSGLPLEQPLQLDGGAVTEKYLRAMYDEVRRHAAPDPMIVEGLFGIWLRELARLTVGPPGGRPIPDRLLAVRQRLDHEPARRYALREMAQMAHLSVSQFSATFREHFGASPIAYLLSIRMRLALFHLSDRNLNVAEAGRKVGFDDPFHFSKLFKKRFGVSPQQYRKKALG